jgi:hypothetical protein
MSRPKTVDESFSSEWNKAVAWAQTQGISASAYIPVYQEDASRLQNGYDPMSAAERNRAILAANNPNDVTPSPSDNPQPTSVFDNARNDLASIVTGLEPQHLVTGLFDTLKNTVEAVADPEKEEGANLGTTAANWLQNTLLSFVPGMYDIGTVLRADPNLSGSEGFSALADHPLVSLLDIMPADLGGVVAKTAMGARLAEMGGETAEQAAEHGVTKGFVKALTNRVSGIGIKPGSAAAGISDVTIGDRIQTWLQDSRLGTSAPVQQFVKEYMTNNQLATGIYQNMMAPALDAYSALTPEEQKTFQDIFYQQDRGKNIQDLLKDPSVTLPVREAVTKYLDGPVRFETEEALVGHGGEEPDVAAVRKPDGSIGLYASKQAREVLRARDDLSDGRRVFLERLDATDRLVQNVTRLDKAQYELATTLDKANKGAQEAVPKDDSLLENVVQKRQIGKKEEALTFGKKRDQAQKVFGPSGLVDQMVDAMKKGRDDQVESLVPVLDRRLSEWGLNSVDASSNPAFRAVADQVSKIAKLIEGRQKMNDEIDHRILGEKHLTEREAKDAKLQRDREKKELAQRHVAERTEQRENLKASLGKINAARQVKLKNLDDLYEHMKDAALTKGDNAAVRATKAQADVIYQQVKGDIADLREKWFESKKLANKNYDQQATKARLDAEKAKATLAKKQAVEDKDLAAHHENWKIFHGQLTEEMRSYSQLVKDFHDAVYNHPSDEFTSAEVEIYQRQLMEHAHNAELIDATEKQLKQKSGWEQSRVDALHQNPDLLREQVYLFTRDVYENPANFTPELVDAAKEAMDDVRKSGIDELNTLISQGYHPMWLPRAGTFDRPGSAIKAMVGKGVPHVDVAHARIHDLTATRHDVVLGVSKAMAQTLRRDATIDFVEHSISPRVITGEELLPQIKALPGFEDLDVHVGTSLDAYASKLEELGLTRFDPTDLFGFSMPRWEAHATYLPTGLAKALQKTRDMESKGDKGLFDKTNQVFRYSILGLSPRYTAHILFGGTFLLALRSTPFMPSMLLKAAKAMKDGSIPDEVFRQPAQEGYGRFQYALKEHAFSSGKQLANLAVGEHVEKVQGVLLSKASPFHYLKAAADINFRFTRYATRMQSAIAYMDYMSAAERKTSFIDEVSGQVMPMTKERAMVEGMRHVQEVFGDLRSMSPLERQVAKNILPFYGWTRHILKYVLTMPVDHPWRAMVLALTAFENSEEVPKGLPQRIQFLFFLGSPDSQGNVSAIDTRFMDPLRDVANYASLGGWIQGLNPVFLGPAAMMDPQLVYGSTSLYPNLTYNDMYGIETAGAQGNAVSGLQQFVPQLGALSQALEAATNARSEATSDPNAFYKSVFNSLNIPFAQVQKVNVKQIAAKDEIARYDVAKQAATNAFSSGDFGLLAGYSSVPNPLNPDYEITPKELEAVYNNALASYPGQQPINVLLPPPTPAGY